MGNLILTFLFSLVSSLGISQTFTVPELEKLTNKNWDDFDTYVINKGYQFDKEDTNSFSEGKIYAYKPDGHTNSAAYWISFHKYFLNYDESKAGISWQTTIQTDYINIKNQLKTYGYKFIETGSFKDNTFFKYKKDKKIITIYIGKSENLHVGKITFYEINLTILK